MRVHTIHFTGTLLALVLHKLCIITAFAQLLRCFNIPVNIFCMYIGYFEVKHQGERCITTFLWSKYKCKVTFKAKVRKTFIQSPQLQRSNNLLQAKSITLYFHQKCAPTMAYIMLIIRLYWHMHIVVKLKQSLRDSLYCFEPPTLISCSSGWNFPNLIPMPKFSGCFSSIVWLFVSNFKSDKYIWSNVTLDTINGSNKVNCHQSCTMRH